MSVPVPHSIHPVREEKRKTKPKTDAGFAKDESVGITVVEDVNKIKTTEKKKKKEKNKGGDTSNVIGDKHESGTKHVKKRKLEEEKDEKEKEINPGCVSMKEKKKRKSEKKNNADEETNTKVCDESYTEMEPPSSEKKKKIKKSKHASESSREMPEKIVQEYDMEPPSSEKKKKIKKSKIARESSREMPEKIVEEYDMEPPSSEKKKKIKKSNHAGENSREMPEKIVEEYDMEPPSSEKKKKRKESNHAGESSREMPEKIVEEYDMEPPSSEKKKKRKESKHASESSREMPAKIVEESSTEKKKKRKKTKHASESSREMPEKIVQEHDMELDNNRDSSGSIRKEEKKNKKKKEEEKSNNSRSSNSKSVKDAKGKNVKEGETKTNKKPSKKVKFSGDVEIFPISDADIKEGGLVRGKRFSTEEDQFLQDAIMKYIKEHDLGDDGIRKVMNCRNYPEIRNCWKEISPVMPWRTQNSIYNRAHILYQRADKREWTPEEKEALRNFFKEHGPDWRKFADEFGKYRIHVKDTWRRINVPNKKEGPWSQEEYQNYFDLVNMDLRMKIFEEKKSKHGMLRDDIAWGAVSHKLSTRSDSECCMKWYKQLASPLVQQKLWSDLDDYRLLNELAARDYSSVEEVDWDNLLEHRSGDICQKRWHQMYNHLGEHGDKAFADQLEVLLNRYCPDVHEAREIYQNKTPVD